MIHECSLTNSTLDARLSLPVSHTYRGNAISTLVKHSQKKDSIVVTYPRQNVPLLPSDPGGLVNLRHITTMLS